MDAREVSANAVLAYHDLLERKHLDETVEILDTAIRQRGLSVAGRPVCSVLRPQFLAAETYEMVLRASRLVMHGFADLARRLLKDSSLRARLELSPEEDAIVTIDTGYGAPDVSARLDGFLDAEGRFRFVEYNADSPGGLAFGDVLGEVFASTPLVQEFRRKHPFRVVPTRSRTFDALVACYHRWGGRGLPNIAIVDWRATPTRAEFDLMREHFEPRGCRVIVADPEDLEYSGGRLYAGGAQVDLVYKRIVVFELLQRLGLQHPLVRAVRDRAVCMANGFAVQMLFQKSLFALLSDPYFYQPDSPEVSDAIQQHIPWTRLVRDGKTRYGDRTVDMLPFIAENRQNLVLKPSSEYGGKGVQLGWECTDEQWQEALKSALATTHIVQERVNLGTETYPSIEGGRLHFEKRYFDLDPYVWHGDRVEGCGVRLSRVALLNVSAGGGSATPLFILD